MFTVQNQNDLEPIRLVSISEHSIHLPLANLEVLPPVNDLEPDLLNENSSRFDNVMYLHPNKIVDDDDQLKGFGH